MIAWRVVVKVRDSIACDDRIDRRKLLSSGVGAGSFCSEIRLFGRAGQHCYFYDHRDGESSRKGALLILLLDSAILIK
jgi:hypothetical protein